MFLVCQRADEFARPQPLDNPVSLRSWYILYFSYFSLWSLVRFLFYCAVCLERGYFSVSRQPCFSLPGETGVTVSDAPRHRATCARMNSNHAPRDSAPWFFLLHLSFFPLFLISFPLSRSLPRCHFAHDRERKKRELLSLWIKIPTKSTKLRIRDTQKTQILPAYLICVSVRNFFLMLIPRIRNITFKHAWIQKIEN